MLKAARESSIGSSFFLTVFSATSRSIALVFAGNILNKGMGLVSTILISRTLGPESYGLYAVAIMLLSMISDLADMGLNSGIVRFVAPLVSRGDIIDANRFLHVALRWKLMSAVSFFVLLLVSAEPLATYVFHKQELAFYFQLAAMGVIGALFPGFIGAVLQSYSLFGRKVLADSVIGLLKVVTILLLMFTNLLNPSSSILAFGAAPTIGLVFGFMLSPRGYFRGFKWDGEIAREMFGFSKWIMVSTVTVILYSRMELLIVGVLLDTYSVGIMSVATQMVLAVSLLLGAITTVLTPKVVSLELKEQMERYIRLSLRASLAITAGLVPAIIWAEPLTVLVFGPSYVEGANVFRVFLLAHICAIFINPLSLLLFTLNKPAVISWVNVLQLFISVSSLYFLIDAFGVIGSGYSALLVRFTAVLLIGFALQYYLRRLGSEKPDRSDAL